MDAFHALAEPSRRRILVLLAGHERSVTRIAERFQQTRPAISQHLRVLLDAGLVEQRKVGRERLYRARPEGLREVVDWLSYFDAFWARGLDGLGAYLGRDG